MDRGQLMRNATGRETLACPACETADDLLWSDSGGVCACGNAIPIRDGLIFYTDAKDLEAIPEVQVRDRQAAGYLKHGKLPSQVAAVRRYLDSLPLSVYERPVLELGCGPGPMTPLLADGGRAVISIDFSADSLRYNRDNVPPADRMGVTYVQADLTALRMAPASTNLLMMCDFLQHIPGHSQRANLIHRACHWLAPGGYLYLSFLNFNLKNYLKGDLHGSFSDGGIGYERLLCDEVIKTLPANLEVSAVHPLHLSNDPVMDRGLSRIPGARWFSRTIAVHGRKAKCTVSV